MQKSTSVSPLDWDDARKFLAVARAGQMLGAARTLGINQATLSRRMASLEAALGAKLLVRRTAPPTASASASASSPRGCPSSPSAIRG